MTAFSATVNGVAAQGAAYAFTNVAGTFSETQKLTASDGGLFDNFGASVSIDGDTLVIAADGATVDSNPAQGEVYVFTLVNGTWTETQKLTADDGIAFDNFGLSVALNGSTILVGSPQAIIGGAFAQGAVYVYTNSGGTWSQLQKLARTARQHFGNRSRSAATRRADRSDGAAATLRRWSRSADSERARERTVLRRRTGLALARPTSSPIFSGTWSEMQKSDRERFPERVFNFGNTLTLHNRAIKRLTSRASMVATIVGPGQGLLLTKCGRWSESDTLTASDGTTDDFFGAALALGPDTVLVSTPHPVINGNSFQGAAYFFDHTPGGQ